MSTLKNSVINDNSYLALPSGTTGERPGSPSVGMTRFNQSTGGIEFYSSSGWVTISGLGIIGVSPSTFNGEQYSAFTIRGTGFVQGCTAKFLTNTGAEVTPATTVVESQQSILITTPRDFLVSEEPLGVRVYSPLGQYVSLTGVIDCGTIPSWTTPAGSLGTVYISNPEVNYTVAATDSDVNSTLSYSFISGSLPGGLNINTSTGVISGTAVIPASQTVYSFTIRASDNAGNTADRNFSITVNSSYQVYTTFSYTGAEQTFTVPANMPKILAKVWGAGGGTGGSYNGTFGGGAGFSTGTITVSSGTVLKIIVGGGGNHSRNAVTTGGFGGGGDGGNPSGYEGSASGGGYSGIFYQNVDFTRAIILAGGGGGGAGNGNNGYAYNYNQTGFGGAGGGINGQSAAGSYASANGGTQTAGGNRNANSSGSGYTDGGTLYGGRGGNFYSSNNHSAGGGGGGGYYGGGGGRGGEGNVTAGDAGGGGSGFIGGATWGLDTVRATTQTGTGAGQYNTDQGRAPPAGTSDPQWNSSAGYSGYGRASGQPGYVVIMI